MQIDFEKFYAAHLNLSEIGYDNQKKINNFSVIAIGCGGLASGALPILTSSGVGKIILVDGDQVNISNLHRQTLFSLSDINIPKVYAAKTKLQALNPSVEIQAEFEYFTFDNAFSMVENVDLILDFSDNLPTRRLISDVATMKAKHVISGSSIKTQGQLLLYGPGKGSYRTLLGSQYDDYNLKSFENLDEHEFFLRYLAKMLQQNSHSCSEVGVFGCVPNIIGSLMATEVFKFILGFKTSYNFILYDIFETNHPIKYVLLKNKTTDASIEKFKYEDYINECQVGISNLIEESEVSEVTWIEFKSKYNSYQRDSILLVDLRTAIMPNTRKFGEAIHISMKQIIEMFYNILVCNPNSLDKLAAIFGDKKLIFFFCNKGNTSKIVVALFHKFRKLNPIKCLEKTQFYSINKGMSECEPSFQLSNL